MRIMVMFCVMFCCLLISGPAFAGITFIGGKWSTTFDYDYWKDDQYGRYEGAGELPDYWAVSGGINHIYDAETLDEITTDANHAAGGGGKGLRHYQGDGANTEGAGIRLFFAEQQPELWIRFYIKWQAGFKWGSLTYDKLLRLHTPANTDYPVNFTYGAHAIPVLSWADRLDIAGANLAGNEWFKATNSGWATLFGPEGERRESNLNPSDGRWVCLELYLKMNSNVGVYDGIAKLWIDGVLHHQETAIDFTQGHAAALKGWARFAIGENQSRPDNANGPIGYHIAYQDWDDLVIYNRNPPNTDANGNPFIGPIGWNGDAPVALQSPKNLKIVQ